MAKNRLFDNSYFDSCFGAYFRGQETHLERLKDFIDASIRTAVVEALEKVRPHKDEEIDDHCLYYFQEKIDTLIKELNG